MKICSKCGLEKELDNFGKDKSKKDGLNTWCKKCYNEHNKQYRQQPQQKKYLKQYRQRPKVKTSRKTPEAKYSKYKHDAKRRHYPFELTLEQFTLIISQPCNYCGSPGPNGIDRKNNDDGYTLNNSVPCCFRCNKIKMDYSVEEMFHHLIKMVNFLKFI